MRDRRRTIARETVDITQRGSYRTNGTDVDIRAAVADAVSGTRLHQPDEVLPEATPAAPVVDVTNESSLAACRRLGEPVACLVFASARSPGGGFLNGAQAQEESIARGSALYPCQLAAGEFYERHRAERGLLYSDRVIHSPGVPVFRDDDDALLERPHLVSFLTAAAPNRAAVAREQPEHLDEVPATLARRARRVLAVAAAHGHRRLVLGAWGCGVFGNDAATVAAVFRDALDECPWFDHVTFAVLGDATYATFADVVGRP